MRHAILNNTEFFGVELATVNLQFANVSKAKNADLPPYKTNLR